MQELQVQDLIEKLKSGEISYDQLYNLDLEMPQYYAIQHYINNQKDNITKPQKLQILFQDIECYNYNNKEFKPELAKAPITAITNYSTFEKVYHIYCMTLPCNLNKLTFDMVPDLEKEFTTDLRNLTFINKKNEEEHYLEEDESVKIHLYQNNELGLIRDSWMHIHQLDPSVLCGFWLDGFDIPYQYNRLKELIGDEKKVAKILSKFGVIKIRKRGLKGIFHIIADYPVLDTQHLYKPRDEGGLIN